MLSLPLFLFKFNTKNTLQNKSAVSVTYYAINTKKVEMNELKMKSAPHSRFYVLKSFADVLLHMHFKLFKRRILPRIPSQLFHFISIIIVQS